jgi:ferredoxin
MNEEIYPPPCIHADGKSLCAGCQECYDVDPDAYWEFGDHPAGLERWKREQELIAASAAESAVGSAGMHDDPNIPF